MTDITAKELQERLEKGEKINLIDVREPFEYDEDNLDGKLIPLGEIANRLSELESLKDEEVIVHCRSGARSDNAKKYMLSQGFSNVRNLLGGILAYREL